LDTNHKRPLHFAEVLAPQPSPQGIDMVTTLRHFAIVTYAVPPERVRPYVHPRFDLDTFSGSDGRPLVWVSAVPFIDQDFRLMRLPWPAFQFGQTNYRTYVLDPATGEHAVWFFGTTLDSWSVLIPRYLWRLPWHYGRVQFTCAYDQSRRRYNHYLMSTRSDWAAVELELEDSGQPVTELEHFTDLEAALVLLTHPVTGFYYRRDGRLGSYRIWHDRLHGTLAHCRHARFSLLDRLGLVPYAEQPHPYNVFLQHETEFIIHLPPREERGSGGAGEQGSRGD
jgi:hypothetical protein